MNEIIAGEFYQLAVRKKMYPKKANLQFHLDYIFGDLDLTNKQVLDVGGGLGLLTFYAAVKGAARAVCLEPECDGSDEGMIRKFNEFKDDLSSPLPVEHLPLTLQEFISTGHEEEFDVVVMHNSINHLNEEACINLLKSRSSYNLYKDIFRDVYRKMKTGGNLIIADCGSKNMFQFLGIKSVFAPTIEWHIHQEPRSWISLLQEVGFKNPQVRGAVRMALERSVKH